ncbi:MAG: hypothetical protein Q9179_003081 [Wetmoreana sp. 5 TL-2023]
MTKFMSPGDVGFKRVVAQLNRWVQELRADENISSADIGDFMASLSTAETKMRIAGVRSSHKDTFHWLFDPRIVSFSQWLGEHSQPFYWIQGKPGSGKSTLMKFAMRDSRLLNLLGRTSEVHWTCVAFFFHDRGSPVQKSLVGMLREIISSILSELPQLLPHAIQSYKELVKGQRTRLPTWDLEALMALMEKIIGQRGTRIKLLLFLDALDEHEGDNNRLIELLKDWSQMADGYYVTLKICLASRPWPVFTACFGRGPNFPIHEYTRDDIRVYTESSLNSSIQGPSELLGPESVASLAEQITAKAQGVFIWVRLVTDLLAKNIRDGTHYQLQRMIAGLPEELQELYDYTLSRVDPEYADASHIMFQLVACSIEPLSLPTLIRATEYTLGLYYDQALDDEPMISSAMALSWLISHSGGLLETYDTSLTKPSDIASFNKEKDLGAPGRYVQFLHQTTKEYVQSSRGQRAMERRAGPVAEKNGFYLLALCSQSCSSWVAPIKIHMFYYAKQVESQGQIDERIDIRDDYARGPDEDSPCDFRWWLEQHEERFFRLVLSNKLLAAEDTKTGKDYLLLAVIVAANLVFMVERSLSSEILDFIKKSSNDKLQICLLQVAIGGPDIIPAHLQDRVTMVRKLLSMNYPPDPDTIPWDGREGITDDFEFAKSSIQPLIFLFTRPVAVRHSERTRISIAKALLDSDAYISRVPVLLYYPKTGALHDVPLFSYCVQHESAAFVRLFLRYDPEIFERCSYGWLPIDYAILRQDSAILAALQGYQTKRLRPDFDPSLEATDSVPKSLILPSVTVLASIGHPALAILLARSKEPRKIPHSLRRLPILERERLFPATNKT